MAEHSTPHGVSSDDSSVESRAKDSKHRDSVKSTNPKRRTLKPYLVDFERLFYPHERKVEDAKTADYGFYSERGAIPWGTTLLITGAPGVGKTIFAMSFVRSLYVGHYWTCGALQKDGSLNTAKIDYADLPILYYVSLEIFPEKLKKAVEPFGWLIKGEHADEFFREEEGSNETPKDGAKSSGTRNSDKRPTIRIITATPEVDRPVPGAEELLSSIFAQIGRAQAREDENRKVIVIIDSLTALIRTRGDYSERRRQTHETIYRLQKLFQKNQLILTILIAESDSSGSKDGQTDNMVEEYLADMVFRLNTEKLQLGRRLRTLEIPKSQGQNVIIGEHTWLILTHQSIGSLIEEKTLRQRIWRSVGKGEPAGKSEASGHHFGTVVVLPRSRGFSRGASDEIRPTGKPLLSGTRGLDSMLDYRPEDWITQVPKKTETGALEEASTTLLVGAAGSGKTGIGLQFLFQYWEDLDAQGSEARQPVCPPVLITFDYASVEVKKTIRQHWERWKSAKERKSKKFPQDGDINNVVTTLVFRQAHIDLNLVVAQARECILGSANPDQPTGVPDRLMIDGLSEWLSSFEGKTREQVLEALLNSIFEARAERAKEGTDNQNRPLTLMICYEVDEANPQAVSATFGIPAQNIFVIKQVSIQDKTRRIIYLAKAEMKKSDRAVREVRRDGDEGPLRIMASLDEFDRVLTPNEIEPASVSLQFFAENLAEHAWSRWALHHLRKLKPLKYRSMTFGRVENSRTFEHSGGFAGSPELRLISVDEWWIHGQLTRGAATATESRGQVPMLNLANLWQEADGESSRPTHQGLEGSWSDYWYFEVEKARGRSGMAAGRHGAGNPSKPAEKIEAEDNLYAVPAYMDFSLFCVNLSLFQRAFEESRKEDQAVDSKEAGPDDRTVDFQAVLFAFRDEQKHPHRTKRRQISRGEEEPKPMHEATQKKLRDVWHQASDAFPRTWVPAGRLGEGMADAEAPIKPGSANRKTAEARRKEGWKAGKDYFEGRKLENFKIWDTPEKAGSMLELIPFRKRAQKTPKLFAVDTSTPESLCCVWFEMAWAFGARKDFLLDTHELPKPNKDGSISGPPEVEALVFLQELVLRGLMPARATLEKTREALFSRQWYSTISYLAQDAANEERLLPIPFWPVRADDARTWCECLQEAIERFRRTLGRTEIALDAVVDTAAESSELAKWKTELSETSGKLKRHLMVLKRHCDSRNETNWIIKKGKKVLEDLVTHTNHYRERLEDPEIKRHLQSPPAMRARHPGKEPESAIQNEKVKKPLHAPDYRDLVEIFQSHTLRLGLVIAGVTPEKQVIADAHLKSRNTVGSGSEAAGAMRAILKLWRSNPYVTPLAGRLSKCKALEPGSEDPGRRYAATLTGYSSSGSWLYSVHNRSLSLSLAKPLLEELTSLQAAEKRARLGAGLPSRKDFYATSGDEYAPNCENLSWRDILRFAGSRSRERAQAVSPSDDILARFHLISERLLDLLQRAYDDRPQEPEGMVDKLKDAVDRAIEFVREIRGSVAHECRTQDAESNEGGEK